MHGLSIGVDYREAGLEMVDPRKRRGERTIKNRSSLHGPAALSGTGARIGTVGQSQSCMVSKLVAQAPCRVKTAR